MSIPTVIFLGPPGTGKSTHSKQLAELTGYYHLPVGALIRKHCEEREQKEECAAMDKKYVAGIPQPDEVVLRLVKEKLASLMEERGIILDAFPLSIGQALALEAMREEFNLSHPIVFFLNASEEVIMKRISERKVCLHCNRIFSPRDQAYTKGVCPECGALLTVRPDNDPGVVHRRYEEYRVRLAPVEDYYRSHASLFIELDGSRDGEEVLEDIKKYLPAIAKHE